MLGQEHLLGDGKLLARAIATDRVPSMILWGPPGSGKTTLARVIAERTRAHFVPFNAVLGGVAELREILAAAKTSRDYEGRRTLLFVDEIHRFNKGQQDAFLPHVEDGTVTLIGATTENPSFSVNAPLLSRCKVFRLRGHEIPMKERTAKGTAVVNLLNLSPSETIEAIVSTKDFPETSSLVFATKQGVVKKTPFTEYDKSRREGFIAINLKDGDELVRVVETQAEDHCFIVTLRGMTIRFKASDVRDMGRSAAGVRGIRLKADDEVVSLDVAREDADLLLVTDAGYGKRVKVERFNAQGRGGQGVRGIKLTAARGRVVSAFMVNLEEQILLVSSGGILIRTAVREISSQGRDATGVRVMNLDDGQSVAAVARVAEEAPTEES